MNTQNKILLGVSLFAMTFSFGATAQTCKPVPSCESLGYTKTSCSGDSLKCPFDTSKMYCICNYTATSKPAHCATATDSCEKNGTTYYASTCASCNGGFILNNGSCAPRCELGSIYYSDDTCSSEVISGKTPIGVVYDTDRKLVVSLKYAEIPWNYGTDTCYNIPEVMDDLHESTAQQDFNGKSNTDAIVAYAKSSGLPHKAAQYCHDMTTGGKTWYLPALGEIIPLGTNYSTVNASLSKVGAAFLANVVSDAHWTSTEHSKSYAYTLVPRESHVANKGKKYNSFVRCIFAHE